MYEYRYSRGTNAGSALVKCLGDTKYLESGWAHPSFIPFNSLIYHTSVSIVLSRPERSVSIGEVRLGLGGKSPRWDN